MFPRTNVGYAVLGPPVQAQIARLAGQSTFFSVSSALVVCVRPVNWQTMGKELRSWPEVMTRPDHKRDRWRMVRNPGDIQDHLRKETLELKGMKTLVLDEADRMLDMGFIDVVKDIIRLHPGPARRCCFPRLRKNQTFVSFRAA